MNIFQRAYDFFWKLKTPMWLKNILDEMWAAIVASFLAIGKDKVNQLQDKIIEVAGKNLTNKEKFRIVYNFAIEIGIQLAESVLNVLINMLVLKLKQARKI